MIAKIGHGSKIYGVLLYNHKKVLQNKGQILHLNNMLETPDGNYTTAQLLSSFLPYLASNRKTEKTAIHISLNPNPNDKVSDEDFIKMANDYMSKMGYRDQPYVIFKHNDIERTHIHIVSTTVDMEGKKISDSFEKKKSMEICRELERKYGLTLAEEKDTMSEELSFTPVDYSRGDIKSQIAAVVRYLPKYYNMQSLGSYNVLLSLFNISVEHVKRDYNGEIKEGLLYFALDSAGKKVSNPFKSALFGKQAGLAALNSHFEKSKKVSPEIKDKTRQMITEAVNLTTNENDFKYYLLKHGINTVIRRNEQDRLYGITFIDHNTRNVFNGSNLGKQFSANVFHNLFPKINPNEKVLLLPATNETTYGSLQQELHLLFDFMTNTATLMNDWGLLNSLLLDNLVEDPEEQEFAFQMKKKKKRGLKR